MDKFRTKLFQIGQELTRDDLVRLKFLCKDIIPAGKAEFITTPLDFLQELERIGKLSEDNPHFLAEYLAHIGRNDLSDKLLKKSNEEEELIEKFDTKIRIKQKASQFEILDGDIVEDGENRVQAHLAVITSKDQVEQVLAELKKKDPDVAKATHKIWAYRIFNTERNAYDINCDDDGDDSSGARVLRFLQKTRATDVMVVVSCWYETTAEDFGENRFKCIQKSVLDLFLTYRIVRIPSARIKTFYEEIKYTPFGKAKEQKTPKFDILHGETIKDRKSTFQAHLADITSREEVDQVLEELKKDRKIAKATYNMWACRIYDEKKKSYFEEGNDDGENLGGERLLHLLQRRDAKNVVVIVTRWHGGIHLGNDRFKHINKCASDLLQQRRIVETSMASTEWKAVKDGSSSEMVRGRHSAALTNIQEGKKPKCILETAIGEAPHTDILKTTLKILLDTPRPLGGDIKSLASAFGYNSNEIHYLTTKPYGSATEDLLHDKGHVSIGFLLEKLVFIGREDAAGKLRDYITMQDCKCEDCQPIATRTSKEFVNFARLMRLTTHCGTQVLREIFDSIHPPSSLHSTLHSTAVHSRLKGLRAKKILNFQQWSILYPASESTPVTSADFNIALIYLLLRNICGLLPPKKGWGRIPEATDLSREADLVRVKGYRNELIHTTDTAVSDSDFDKYWKEISDELVRLGGPQYESYIGRLKVERMDLEVTESLDKAVDEIAAKPEALGKPIATRTSNEFVNFARLMRLTIDYGTQVLREIFDSIHPPSSLHSTLHSPKAYPLLKSLRAKRILSTHQWDILYPASKSTPVTSADFNIALLFLLLRNICGLTPPKTGWDKPPIDTDLSREADLVRVKGYRNKLVHTTDTAVSDSEFDKYWKEISDVLVRLGGPLYESYIDRLKVEPNDPEGQEEFPKLSGEWKQTEKSLKTAEQRKDKLEEMEEKQDTPEPLLQDADDDDDDDDDKDDADDLGSAEISIDEMGGSYDVSRNGVSLYFPPNAVAKRWVVTCSVQSKDYSPSPVGADETLVSNIVELGPNDVDIRQPIKVILMHSGPGRDLGYETAVKAFNKDNDVWEEIEELNDKSHLPEHSIQVEVSKLTILAVVTRLITDRFQVTSKGCVVRSSVCDDVIVEFPEGAVDKTVEGTLKLMLMSEIIYQSKDACPILCMDGLSSITFSKPVIVKMPVPDDTAQYSTNEIRLLRLEDKNWEDVTHEVHIVKFKTHIEFQVKHFSCFWPWKSKAKIKFASKIFQYLRSSPQVVCFAAFKDNEEAGSSVQKLTLVCVANHKQREIISNMEDEGCSKLAVATGNRRMRPNDKAYLKINGADVRHMSGVTNFFLSFLKSEVCRKELSVRDTEQDEDNLGEMVVNFFPMLEENFDLLLCTLPMSKHKVFSRSGGPENPSAQQLQVEEQAQSDERTDDFVGECDRFALPYQHQVPASDLKETIGRLEHSIGAIFAKNNSGVETFKGTCFRIGTKYVITCQHVIDDIGKLGIHLSNCCVVFNYGETGQSGNCIGFTKEPLLAFSPIKDLDYAILELYPNGVEGFPRSVTELGFKIAPPGRQLKGGECLTLYGHPGKMKKRIDVSCPIKRKEDIQNLQHMNESSQIQKFYNNPHCATYDVSTFFWGSSGSPGLLMEEKLLVVLHSGGIPIQGTNEHVLEYGHLMSSVVEDAMKKINYGTFRNATEDEIFGPSNQDSPQPMDIDHELSASGQ